MKQFLIARSLIAFALAAFFLWLVDVVTPFSICVAACIAFAFLFLSFSPDRAAFCANSFGTLNTTTVAQRTLTLLLARYPLLSKISTNFSDKPLNFGDTLKVKLVTARTAIDYSTTNGYVPADSAMTETTITINQHKHDTYQVNDQEASSTNINLIEKFASASAYAIGRAVMNSLAALVLNANYSNSSTVDVTAFDRDALIDINGAMDDRDVPDFERFALLKSNYYRALKKDLVVVSNNINPASNTVESGVLPDVDGCQVAKYSAMPTNAENLVGFVTIPEGLALGTTIPMAPPSDLPLGGLVTQVKDDGSGLMLQVREWYNFDLGQHRRTGTLMYGVGVGNAAVLQRIKSA